MPTESIERENVNPDENHSQEALIKQLREANQNLLLATLKAEDLQAQAEANKRKQDKFIAMMSHELRNPLTTIVLAAKVLDSIVGAHPRLSSLQKTISRQSNALQIVVDDLMDASRIITGKITINRHLVCLNEIIESAIETSRPVIDVHGHILIVDFSDEEMQLDVDPIRISQVISNLLTNAAKFTPPNGHISLTVSSNAKHVQLSVKDDGIGISQEIQSEIFDLFSQGPQGLYRKNGGLGIGLSLVRSIVEAHSGSVSVISAGKNAGSEFIVTLPLPSSLS